MRGEARKIDAARREALCDALRGAGLDSELESVRSLSGGCIHEVLRLTFQGGGSAVAKVNNASQEALFREEATGLEALASTQAVLVPKPLGVTVTRGFVILLMEALEPGRADRATWMRFGEELAALHSKTSQMEAAGRYGFTIDNHLGTTFQPNSWRDDWVDFNAEHRLGHQVRLARDGGLLDGGEIKSVQNVIDRLDQLIPRSPAPALLHGDLWSGNALPARHAGESRVAVIDPAPYYGDRYADIAMMRLFGGFPRECFDRYNDSVGDDDGVSTRIAVYQLYHLLNHVNIFGRSYASQAVSLARSLA